METKPDNNETFLADWLAGKISDDELRQIVPEADFEAYRELKRALHTYQVPNPDMEMNYSAIKSKMIAKNASKPTIFFSLFKYVAVAASLLLLVGLYHLFIFSNTTKTGIGSSSIISLSDNSTVTLNAGSEVSYPSLFYYNRSIKLEGEAFFEVEKGGKFTVKTKQGYVEVLGTKFNVNARPDFFEIICYEGKVNVCSNDKSVVLAIGDAIRFYENKSETWKENEEHPLWINGESSFRNAPMHHVIAQFRNQYDYEVEYPQALKQTRFTGSFTHKNLTTALKSVCIPMNLKYTKTDTGKIIISE